MTFRYDAPCGLYCGACGTVIAVKNGNLEEQAKKWDMTPEEAKCHGCKAQNTAKFCSGCKFVDCVASKGIEYCAQCNEFPCSDLENFCNDEWPHHSVVLKNSERMREIGIEKWLEEQKQRWSCSNCGTAFMWYAEKCDQCGAEVRNANDEDKEIKDSSGSPS